jgi:hypothetical protein
MLLAELDMDLTLFHLFAKGEAYARTVRCPGLRRLPHHHLFPIEMTFGKFGEVSGLVKCAWGGK